MKLDFTEMDQSKTKKKGCMALVLERTHTRRAGIKAQMWGAGVEVGCKVACQTDVSLLNKLKYRLFYEIWYWNVIVLYHAAADNLLLSSQLLGLC